ncbi:SGNH/GDSL hydrolase family protein [Sphingomonas aliaeris]|uniref:SGNH/GDSL hydrolase family protein n=1 Tax=Sphingomonas aliaeris TaxID=2759526 RepID=A0A974NV28_9SPHN|nr:SGNH/GDSL hydrolase family protein [Sphingomonas aliaeris]QQV77355.1 SGNH/GDSL hydrolase family protein [Sphingomonas aliaeris]
MTLAVFTRLLGAAALVALAAKPAQAEWVAGWMAAPFPATPVLAAHDIRDYSNATVRQELVVGTSGSRLRVRMTNALGTVPLSFASALIEIDGQMIPLHFAGQPGAILPPGAALTSDPVARRINRFDRIAITVRYGANPVPAAHLLTVGVAYADGRTRTGRGPAPATMVEVDRIRPGRVIVALGDSMTEGARAKPESFTGWPEMFAARLASLPRYRDWSVVNAGIHGNRLLRDGAGPNALARLDRDVLAVPGVTDVLLFEGINDIGWGNSKPATDGPVDAATVIAAYSQIIHRAHDKGVRVVGATIPPYRGSIYFTARGDVVRQAVNGWIRTSGAFDAVVDFAAALADKTNPSQLDPANDSGDHLHPSDAGYRKMAAAIDPRVAFPVR